MEKIILKVLKEFRDTDFSKLSEYDWDTMIEKFNDERNEEFWVYFDKNNEEYSNANGDVYFSTRTAYDDMPELQLNFSAYNKLGDVITSLSENYKYVDWSEIQDFSDKDLEKLADDWRMYIEMWKDSVLKEYHANLYNQNKTEQSNDSEFNPLSNETIDELVKNKNDSSALDEFRAKHSENSETDTNTDSDKGDKNSPKRHKQ